MRPGNWLFYATGGFAWTYDQLSLTQLATGTSESPFLWRLGFAAGTGVEVPVAPHWTARLEYLFTDYGNSSTAFFAGAQRIDSNFALQELRVGLNYQFGNVTPPAPIVVKGAGRAGSRRRQLSRPNHFPGTSLSRVSLALSGHQ